MKKSLFFTAIFLSSTMIFGQGETCSCTDNPWSAFAYMINEHHEKLPPRQEELTASTDFTGFHFNSSWDEEEVFDEIEFDEMEEHFNKKEQPNLNITNNRNFDFGKNNPVEIINKKPNLLSEISGEKTFEKEKKEEIDVPGIEENPKENYSKRDEPKEILGIENPPPSRNKIERETPENEFDDGKNEIKKNKYSSSSKIKTKKKWKGPRLKKQKKPKKYKGKCPIF